ncbi:MAG: addiction module protein [Pseudomonadota bacterium]|jgi:putative addiction module component (TIGR02574 family)|nr:addiction module protein [Pseudomonadota bacterium]|tara:strand:- start:245 stop:520 length:276 start_codon:yes stop_codon:yes gene_type:complete
MRIQELIDEANALPVDERALMIESLLKSLNPIESDVDEKWANVAEKRLAELDSGAVEAIPGEEVFNKIRSRLLNWDRGRIGALNCLDLRIS